MKLFRLTGRPSRRLLALTILAALVAGLLIADTLVGRQLSARVADAAACRLAIDDAEVDTHGWPRSLALVTHEVSGVTVRADEVEVAGVDTSLELDFSDVRLRDGGLHVSGGSGWVAVPVDALLAQLGGGLGAGAEVSEQDGQLEISLGGGEYAVLLSPEVTDGRLQVRPTGISVGDRVMEGALAESLVDRALSRSAGGRAADLLGSGLELPFPSRVHLEGVSVVDSALRLGLTVEEGDPSGLLGREGSCG